MRAMCQAQLCYLLGERIDLSVKAFFPLKLYKKVMHLLFMRVKRIIWSLTHREDKYLLNECSYGVGT